jgi:prophage tail gpP-like protein
MTTKVLPKLDNVSFSEVAKGGIQKQLEKTGRLPPVTILISPLDQNIKPFTINRFLSYQFQSSILIPVDTFNFTFVAPDDERPLNKIIKEGDLVSLFANGEALATGIIDTTEIETEANFGEKISITGRDLMGQLEDHSVVDLDSSPIYANAYGVQQVINKLIANTRIPNALFQDVPTSKNIKFMGEPMESKLTALQRFLEPLNILAWMDPFGKIKIGKPNMKQRPKANFICSKSKRQSNITDIRVLRAAAGVPNIVIPIWSGTESVQDKIGKSQAFYNSAKGPARLLKLNHRLPRTVVVSNPDATTPQGLADVNFIEAAGSNLLQAYAKREVARLNQKEVIVQVNVPSHYNESGEPFSVDTTYKIEYDRGDIDEVMYLYQVDYKLSEDSGQQTDLYFCRLGTIVADIRIP